MKEHISEKTYFFPLRLFLFGVGQLSCSSSLPIPPSTQGSLGPISNLVWMSFFFVQVIPYVTTIFGGLRAGKMVMLQGAVPLNARR